VGENTLYIMLTSYLELATEVVLEPMSPFTLNNSLFSIQNMSNEIL